MVLPVAREVRILGPAAPSRVPRPAAGITAQILMATGLSDCEGRAVLASWDR